MDGVSVLGLVVLAGAVLGVFALFAVLFANKRTRLFATVSLVGCALVGILLFTYAIARSGYQAQRRVMEEFREVHDLQRAVQKARLESQLAEAKARAEAIGSRAIAQTHTYTETLLNEITKPRIKLDLLTELTRLAEAEPINDPPLIVAKEAPDWGDRPKDDYKPSSDFAKQLFAEHNADWLIIKRPRSKKGLNDCLAIERWAVRDNVRKYVVSRSRRKLGKEKMLPKDAELGMDDAELYRRFVKHRQLVENDGEHTIYTMIVIRNAEGGDELLEKTLALAGNQPAETVVSQPDTDAERPDAEKPDWVTTPPRRVGEVFRQVLTSGPFATLEECYRDADARLNAVAYQYANNKQLHLGEGSRVAASDDLRRVPGDWGGPAIAELRRRVARDTHVETVEASFGPMKRLYTLVEITPDDGRWLVAKQQEHEQRERLTLVALVAAGVIGLLALAFTLLKLDEATRGYYTKRLLIGVPAALLLVAIAALVLVA